MLKHIKSAAKLFSPRHQALFLEYKVDMRPRFGQGQAPHPGLYKIIDAERNAYKQLLTDFMAYKEVLWKIKKSGEETDENLPRWNNEYLPGLDIFVLYGMLAKFKPKTYIEIGSGNSTMVARKAIKEHNLDTKIISIDPQPRASIDQLSDKVVRKPLENSDLSFVDDLHAGDILFIDNSHRSFPNSDVTVCFLEVIPRLRKGVIVHIHDIYLPHDYPQFMADRFYNEQYLLACFLIANPDYFRVLMPNFHVSEEKEIASVIEPFWQNPNLSGVERHGGSFWMVKN